MEYDTPTTTLPELSMLSPMDMLHVDTPRMRDMMVVLKLEDDSFVVQSGTSERLTLYTTYAVKQLIGALEKRYALTYRLTRLVMDDQK